jgi:hypothetical protein
MELPCADLAYSQMMAQIQKQTAKKDEERMRKMKSMSANCEKGMKLVGLIVGTPTFFGWNGET